MDKLALPRGQVRLYRVRGDCWTLCSDWLPNLVLYSWGAIVGRLLTAGDSAYRINGMYIEYENVANPNDTVSTPSFTRSYNSGRPYYDSLASSSSRDYLRLGLSASRLDSTDAASYPGGNLAVFLARTAGSQGVHGRAFSHTNNSKICGGALVAMPELNDPTRDIVLSRFYLPTAQQMVKPADVHVGLEWKLELL